MKTYPISNSSTETIEFRASDDQYALVHTTKVPKWNSPKTIIMNRRELALLFYAIQDEL